jgi:hypothetical protein
MAYPTAYTSSVAIPLPSEQAVRQIMGKSYDPERTLNVLKMFAGTPPCQCEVKHLSRAI